MFLIERERVGAFFKTQEHKNNSLNRVHANTIMHIMWGISAMFALFKGRPGVDWVLVGLAGWLEAVRIMFLSFPIK